MMDVRDGFWHVSLEKQSTYLMTFQTPFGSYRWKRTPFGISSAPEVFQRRMPEFIEGLDGIEVVADNFIAVGYGDTFEETTRDKHPLAFLKRCEERNIRLNDEKLKLRQSEVLFIGHIMTDKGLRVDPAKFRAFVEMPTPTDKAVVQRHLGVAQYLDKFLPHLSDITKLLRELTKSDVLWFCDEKKTALDTNKQSPVRRYCLLQRKR